MATKKENNELVVVQLATTGETYLCQLDGNQMVDTMLLDQESLSRRVFETYIKRRNLGELDTFGLSATSDHTVKKLRDHEKATLAHVWGMFKMAKAQAKAYTENNTYDALYAGK